MASAPAAPPHRCSAVLAPGLLARRAIRAWILDVRVTRRLASFGGLEAVNLPVLSIEESGPWASLGTRITIGAQPLAVHRMLYRIASQLCYTKGNYIHRMKQSSMVVVSFGIVQTSSTCPDKMPPLLAASYVNVTEVRPRSSTLRDRLNKELDSIDRLIVP
jgi:hypothetical protein